MFPNKVANSCSLFFVSFFATFITFFAFFFAVFVAVFVTPTALFTGADTKLSIPVKSESISRLNALSARRLERLGVFAPARGVLRRTRCPDFRPLVRLLVRLHLLAARHADVRRSDELQKRPSERQF